MDQNPNTNPAPQPVTAPAQPTVVDSGQYESNPFKLFGPSWHAIKLNLGSLVLSVFAIGGAFLLSLAIPVLLIAIAGGFSKASDGGSSAVAAVLGLVGVLVGLGVGIYLGFRLVVASQLILLASAKGQKTSLGEEFKAAKPFIWRQLGYGLVFGLLVVLGLILFVVPGIIAMIWYGFGGYAILEENLGVGAALSRSKQLVQGRFWDMFGLASLPNLFNFLSIIPILGSIAAFVLSVMYSAANPLRYLALKDYKDNNKPLPPTSKLNFLAPVIFIIAIPLSFIPAINDARHDVDKQNNSVQLDDNGSSSTNFSTDDSSLQQ